MPGRNLMPTALALAALVAPELGPSPVMAATYRTDNFEVTAPSREAAEEVGRAAERCRKELALLWLGKEAPAWDKPCEVRVEVTDKGAYASTTAGFLDGKVVMQRIRLEGSLDEIMAEAPRQVTHALLDDWLGRPLPRWAETGTAGLVESSALRARDYQWVWDNVDGKQFVSLRRLLPLHDFPMKNWNAIYAEGLSLTEFLVRKGGRPKLLAFVAQGERDGWDKAADAQYGFATVDDLERAWLTRVREGEGSEGRD